MDHDTAVDVLDVHEKTKAHLEDVVNTQYSKKHRVPVESHHDGAKNTLFGWTDDDKGILTYHQSQL